MSYSHMYRYSEDLGSDTYNQPSTGEAQEGGLYVQGWPNIQTTSAIQQDSVSKTIMEGVGREAETERQSSPQIEKQVFQVTKDLATMAIGMEDQLTQLSILWEGVMAKALWEQYGAQCLTFNLCHITCKLVLQYVLGIGFKTSQGCSDVSYKLKESLLSTHTSPSTLSHLTVACNPQHHESAK